MSSHSSNVPSHSPTWTTKNKAGDKGESSAAAASSSMSSTLQQRGFSSNGTRTVGWSNVSQSGSATSGSQNVNVPFDDGSLQHQRLVMFESQGPLDDSTIEARLHDRTDPITRGIANNDQEARNAFYEARATEAIRQFNNTFTAKN